jgi:hypothetical protein
MDFDGPFGGGFGFGFFHVIGALAWWTFTIFVVLAVATILFLLGRFLIAGTKAANIYIAKHAPQQPAAPAPTTPAAAEPKRTKPAPAPETKPAPTVDPAAPTDTAPTKPAPRTRAPKTPPVEPAP